MKRIKIDRKKCVGCLTCTTACIVSHESTETRSRITIDSNSKYSPIFCRHCDKPECVYTCMTGAMSKFSTVKIDETKIDKNDLVSNIYEDKEGYEYLNSLFFLRHKNIMINSIKHIGIVIGIIFISIIVFIIFKPNVRPIVVKTFINSAPLMVFIMYTISTTERICKAMFYNCDKSLLRYSYYRNEKVILANFTSRLKKVMSINIIPAIELSLAFIIITICCGQPYSIIKVIPTCICIICLSGFFSIHHLFMYYVIQPYTAELTIKSPLFKTVNMVMYFLSYMCLRLKTSSYYFTIGVIITTIIYMIIALIVIYRVAPKTFKLK